MAEREPNASSSQFMDLEVPEYAYMFGFLQADGHLAQGSGQKGRLAVEVSIRDIDLLYRFKQLTPYNSSVTERIRSTNFAMSHHSATWTLCSLDARTKINQLGLPYGRKSKKIAPPRTEFSRRDYLRGVVDADGSIGYTSQGFPFVSLTTASTAVGVYLCRYARQLTGAERLIRRNARDQIYNISYEKETAQALAADLYYPGCLSLGRKQVKADALASWARPVDMRIAHTQRRWTPKDDQVLLQLRDAAAAASELGRTERSCHMRLWRLRTGRVLMPTDH
ncbi:hypothetical protein GCM10009837_86350 [Streptomyces durmitorensis]|uniref:Homing endonuclease LAGLIDADG domain-containing protein n=1 Tax=Streptomyces durmitorensis TaxID=319947 RepID=A0ABY4PTA6_9ACTN|nr:hypothetical protein [Streptomyces durmitorensis]UQT57105.1 hypothetical protein M4V62_19475 [Streptomyces durmitorensis]